MPVHNIINRASVFLRSIEFQFVAGGKRFRHILQRDAILRTFRPRKAGFDFIHIQLKRAGEDGFIAGISPHALRFGIRLDQCDLFIATSAQAHILQRHPVDWEEAARCTILRRHVGNGRAVSQR
ncbi:hypothetical protein D3C87_1651880 [compost metagenome]